MQSAILLEVGHLAVVLGLVLVTGLGWLLAARSRRGARRLRRDAEAARSFELLVKRSADAVIMLDQLGTITYVNPSAMALFGYGEEKVGTSALSILHPEELETTATRIADAAAGDPLAGTTLRRIRHGDGHWVCCESVSTNLLAEPRVAAIVVVLRDVTDRLEAEERAAAEHELTQTILDTTTALVFTFDAEGHITRLNRVAEELTGVTAADLAGIGWSQFVPDEERSTVVEAVGRLGSEVPVVAYEGTVLSSTGEARTIAWTAARLAGADGSADTVVATGIDVTDARRAEAVAREIEQREHDRLAHEATHDALTGLVNRAGLLHRLDRLVAESDAGPVAVLFVDLDGFKAVNDEHGHAVGDVVLQVVARRLVDSVRATDEVGRLGGDEFVVLCPGLDQDRAEATAARIDAAVAEPIDVGTLTLRSGASTGTVSTEGGDAAALLAAADAAMYEVKRSRKTSRATTTATGGAPLHPQEEARLAGLRRLGLLDSPADPFVDTIVRLAADVCGTPIAAVSLIDADRQWFKASIGLEQAESPRSSAFCAHTILDADHAFVVGDALADDRFVDNPFVTGDPNLRFYAGAPIALAGEAPIGSLCVIDDEPRRLTTAQLDTLEGLRDSLVVYLERLDREAVVAGAGADSAVVRTR